MRSVPHLACLHASCRCAAALAISHAAPTRTHARFALCTWSHSVQIFRNHAANQIVIWNNDGFGFRCLEFANVFCVNALVFLNNDNTILIEHIKVG